MRAKIIWAVSVLLAGTLIGYVFTRYPVFNFQSQGVLEDLATDRKPVPELEFMTAVSIDNSPEARPQYGLSSALHVIETLAEGGITRYLAFFPLAVGKEVAKIGPVRSARPYFVEWAHGFGAILVHSGGSKEALAEIANTPEVMDANEFYNEKYFWRDKTAASPHNLYTSTGQLSQLAVKKKWIAGPAEFDWKSKADSPASANIIREIKVFFSTALFATSFKYDSASNSYQRYLSGKLHLDASGKVPIMPKNVIVLYSQSQVIDQNLQTIDLRTLGSGKAVIFRDGGVVQARWEKTTSQSPLALLDADGSVIELNSGLTWIAVIDQRGSATWK